MKPGYDREPINCELLFLRGPARSNRPGQPPPPGRLDHPRSNPAQISGAPTPLNPLLDSTMREREFFFYGKSYPTWERQATAEELKSYTIPK